MKTVCSVALLLSALLSSAAFAASPNYNIVDPVRQFAFIPCGGDAVLEVISVADPSHIALIQQLTTEMGSRTGTIDPQSGRLYLMASKLDPAGTSGPGARGIARYPERTRCS